MNNASTVKKINCMQKIVFSIIRYPGLSPYFLICREDSEKNAPAQLFEGEKTVERYLIETDRAPGNFISDLLHLCDNPFEDYGAIYGKLESENDARELIKIIDELK